MTEIALALLPAQQATLNAIRSPIEHRPAYTADFASELRDELERALAGLVDAAHAVENRSLWVSKRMLAGVFGCEARYLADERTPFAWTVPTARGTVLHKAVELSAHQEFEPDAAVEAALERLVASDDNLGNFLADASAGEYAELKANCVALLTRFSETFPPLPKVWRPAVEVRARTSICGGAIVLSGKYDLTLGSPAPLGDDEGHQRAGKVIIDLKTGSRSGTDPEDLRFYALIETLSVRVPPLGIGSFYVAEGRIEHEAVTVDVLQSAIRRTVEGIARYIELHTDEREPHRHPGPACSWCPISEQCEPGQLWLSDLSD